MSGLVFRRAVTQTGLFPSLLNDNRAELSANQ
jgi:hypothetical protein